MITWIYRLFVLISCPLLVYFQISRDLKGVGIGICVGVFLIIIELLIEQVSLMQLDPTRQMLDSFKGFGTRSTNNAVYLIALPE